MICRDVEVWQQVIWMATSPNEAVRYIVEAIKKAIADNPAEICGR